jgi:hypothetical protein
VAAGGAVLVVALAMFRGRDAPADAAPADSTAAAGAPAPAAADSTLAHDSALAAGAATPNAMDRAAVVARYPRSVFAVSSASGHGTGFLVDSAGLVLTAARLAPATPNAVVEVQVDGERKYRAPVVRREGQLAVVLIPKSACRGCPVLPLARDSAAQKGDSAVAIGSPQHQADTRIRDVVLRDVSATRISASPGVDARNVGTPLVSAGGAVIAVASGRDGFVPAPTVRALLEKVLATRLAVTADSVPRPTWPAKRLAAKDRARAETGEVNDGYRAKEDGFAVLVMTPRVIAWRRAAADSARDAYNPFVVASTLKPGPDGIADPIQRWSEWDEYWNERRAVVVIEVAPEAAPQPFHGSARPIAFEKGNPASVVLKRDGSPVPAIESASVRAVTNVPDYGSRPVFNSALAVFAPTAFAADGRFALEVSDAARGGKVVTIEVPARTIRAIRSDLAAFITP